MATGLMLVWGNHTCVERQALMFQPLANAKARVSMK